MKLLRWAVLVVTLVAISGLMVDHESGSPDSSVAPSTAALASFTAGHGYWLVSSDGGIFNFGDAGFYGSTGAMALNKPVVAMAATPDGKGYWLVSSDGGIFNFGDAGFYGSTGAMALNKPVVAMAATPDGKGYWLVSSDGGIFNFGDAGFYGSTGAMALNKPVMAMAATPDGKGYWLVSSDGGIFNFGDAGFYGSTGAMALNKPVVAMAATPDGKGYWLVSSDGGIFNFGDAGFYGSTGAMALNKPVVAMAATPDGKGYWLVSSDGGIFNFGDAGFYGSTGAIALNKPVVAMAATPGGPNFTSNSSARISLTKSASVVGSSDGQYSAPGQTVDYSYVIKNTGNVTLTPVTLQDPMTGLQNLSCLGTSLAPGASETCTATYTTTQADVNSGSITNTATATGTPPTGPNVISTSSATVSAKETPSISLTKSASVVGSSDGQYSAPGQTVDYSYVIKNTGNVTLTPVTLEDSMTGLQNLSCLGTSLAPGASETCTATYTTTQADVNSGSITNTATATGTPPTGSNVTSTASATVSAKTADPTDPAAPPGLQASAASGSSLVVSWTNETIAQAGGMVVSTYTLTCTGSGCPVPQKVTPAAGSTTSVTLSGLAPATTYTLAVTATNQDGLTGPAASTMATTQAAPPAPTTTSTQQSASSSGKGTIVIGPSGTVTDAATVSGNTTAGAPTGTVTFSVCGPSTSTQPCPSGSQVGSAVTLSSASSSTSGATSASFTPRAVGTYCFAAVFTPANGSNYQASSDNTGTTADANECLTVAPAPTTTSTQQSASSSGKGTIVIGPSGTVTDAATVSGNTTAGAPTGTVTFSVCGPSTSTQPCPSGSQVGSAVTLSSASSSTSGATSASFTPRAVGTYCFAAVFTPANGSNYQASSDNTGTTADANECLTVAPAPTTTSTQQSASTSGKGTIVIGPSGTVTDAATVSGNTTAGAPTGTVTFSVCGPSTSTQPCPSGSQVGSAVTLSSASSSTSGATSASFTPTAVGTYCFAAVFTPANGSNYQASSDNTGTTADANECLTVAPAPTTTSTQQSASTSGKGTIVIGPSGTVTDAATVSGNTTAGAPTGTVTFSVCGPSTSTQPCPSGSQVGSAVTLSSASSSTSGATSASFTPRAVGTYCFAAVFTPANGSNYQASSDNTGTTADANECLTVTTSPPTFSPNSSQSATVASYTNGAAGTTDATITFTGPVPSSWKAASGITPGSAVVDTTNPTVIADQPGTAGLPLGPTIATINGDTISLEQEVLNGSAAVTGFAPVAISMTSANVGDLVRAATCTSYGSDNGCPVYSQTAGSAGMLSVGNLNWDNPLYFVGQDASPRSIPGVNPYGSVGGAPEGTMAANNTEDVTFTQDIAGGQYNGVSSFPSMGTFAYSGEVVNPSNPSDSNAYTSLTQTYAQHMPCCVLSKEAAIYGSNTNFWGWNMSEDYFTQPGGGAGQNQEELSIQNSYSSPGTAGTLGQNGNGNGWNYGVVANDIQVGSASPTSSTMSGTSGTGTLNVATADFANPATNMGLVTQDDAISDTQGYIPANTVVTSVNELTGALGLSHNLTGTIGSGDTITINLLWFLQDGGQNHNADGTCKSAYPNCGQIVLHAGCDWSDIADRPNPTGTIPTKGIVNWLETHAAPQSTGLSAGQTWGNASDPCTNPESGTNGQASGPWFTGSTSIVQDPVVGSGGDTGVWAPYGYIVAQSTVSNLGQGWEVLGTNSIRQNLSLSNFTITATGGKAS